MSTLRYCLETVRDHKSVDPEMSELANQILIKDFVGRELKINLGILLEGIRYWNAIPAPAIRKVIRAYHEWPDRMKTCSEFTEDERSIFLRGTVVPILLNLKKDELRAFCRVHSKTFRVRDNKIQLAWYLASEFLDDENRRTVLLDLAYEVKSKAEAALKKGKYRQPREIYIGEIELAMRLLIGLGELKSKDILKID